MYRKALRRHFLVVGLIVGILIIAYEWFFGCQSLPTMEGSPFSCIYQSPALLFGIAGIGIVVISALELVLPSPKPTTQSRAPQRPTNGTEPGYVNSPVGLTSSRDLT